jgi:murein DD-endopeptidase MepM/ murein hydrolase activator NlpD
VDNTNPQKPQIISPKADSFTNKIPTLKVRMDKNSANSLALNGLRMKKYKVSSITESLKNVQEGLNTITAESVDAAGNRSSNEISFTYDTQKPAPPQITLKPDNTKKTLSIEITGEKNTIAYIYVNQNLQKNIKMRKGRTQIRLIDKWKSGKVYSISARLKDRAGNLSSPSEIAEFIAPDQDILGVGSGEDKDISYPQPPAVKTCHLEVNKDKKEFNQRKCKTNSPKLVHIINHGKGGETYWVDSFGTVQSEIELEITHKYCKKKTFFDPRTWFSCVELTKGNSKETITPRKYIHNYIGNEKLNTYKETVRKGRNFEITSYTFDDPKSKTLRANLKQLDSLKIDGVWIDFKAESKKSNSMKVPKAIEYSEKDFNFMFEKLIGVTQWHGYTAYQSPHPGIDFGSVKEKVIAPASGYIRFLGWDNYGGHCKSGGNVARIEHDNGMHTVYMHMKNFKKQTSGTWEIGERIKKGQQLGISGNSGYWNCQSFGYHLHFELRKDRYQRNHVDPVPFINVNWDKIPTIGWQTYPGRLTGDNPHPGY